uniref:Uncharacterized protein n=1 Tax=Rhipicephalus appendiculatus TaxID=34631 RepID=A0A131YUW9_RHIAP
MAQVASFHSVAFLAAFLFLLSMVQNDGQSFVSAMPPSPLYSSRSHNRAPGVRAPGGTPPLSPRGNRRQSFVRGAVSSSGPFAAVLRPGPRKPYVRDPRRRQGVVFGGWWDSGK